MSWTSEQIIKIKKVIEHLDWSSDEEMGKVIKEIQEIVNDKTPK